MSLPEFYMPTGELINKARASEAEHLQILGQVLDAPALPISPFALGEQVIIDPSLPIIDDSLLVDPSMLIEDPRDYKAELSDSELLMDQR